MLQRSASEQVLYCGSGEIWGDSDCLNSHVFGGVLVNLLCSAPIAGQPGSPAYPLRSFSRFLAFSRSQVRNLVGDPLQKSTEDQAACRWERHPLSESLIRILTLLWGKDMWRSKRRSRKSVQCLYVPYNASCTSPLVVFYFNVSSPHNV